ncbi:MAG: winged helix-turn-helix transcriptional regulator [Alphaproteobacteria bacterium]|nr:winged helix-turn-helix transcriptional regulator [Alphaproteobacteria bacterium]
MALTQAQALDALIWETRMLFRTLRAASDRVHGGPESAARRSILIELTEDTRTAPALAAARHISRQAVQTQLDALAAELLVERLPNPAHKRSWLWRATARGRAQVAELKAREAQVLAELSGLPEVQRIAAASEVLAAVREGLGAV